jgi:hypothetical protein
LLFAGQVFSSWKRPLLTLVLRDSHETALT